jgi:enoyl-CoA hydratase/carnithine racemase
MSEADAVLTEKRGHVAWITLNRPEAMNSINEQVRALLPRAIDDADKDNDVRVLVLRGAGERAFCAGADIKEFRAVAAPIEYRQSRVYEHWVSSLDRVRKPVIASIHGFCLGGGLEIALACDIRIASDDAQLGLPEVSQGTMPGAGGSQRLPRTVGLGRALDMVLSGERISAQEAHRIGLVSRLTPRDKLHAETERLAELIASRAPLAVVFAKEATRKGMEGDFAAGLKLELDLCTHLLQTEDRIEAGAAFREKRKPVFKGR